MDATAALIIVAVLVVAALVVAGGGLDRTRRVRRTRVVERRAAPPVERVVERPADRDVVRERRIVD